MIRLLASFPRTVWVLLGAVLINRLGLVVVPMLALYLRDRGFSEEKAIGAGSIYALGALISAVPAGLLADRYGRRLLLTVLMSATAISMWTLGAADEPRSVLLCVFAVGLFAEAHRPVVSAMLADLVPAALRVPAFALQRTMVNVGSALGPMLGGLLANAQLYSWLFILDGGSAAIFAVLTWFLLPETRPREQRRRPRLGAALRDRRFLLFCLALFPISAAFFAILSALPVDLRDHRDPASGILVQWTANLPLPVFLADALHLPSADFAALLASPPAAFGSLLFVNGAMVVAFEFFLSLKTRWWPSHRVLFSGALLTGLSLLVIGTWRNFDGTFVGIVLLTIGEMIFAPTALHHIARVAPEESRASYLSVFGITHAAALVTAPLLAARLLPSFGAPTYWCLVGAVAILAAPLFLALRVPSALATRTGSIPPESAPGEQSGSGG